MPSEDWERGFAAGYRSAHRTDVRDITTERGDPQPQPKAKRTRKPSAYSKKYGRAFKKVAKRYKKKNGSWKKNGFKLAQKAAHKEAKK